MTCKEATQDIMRYINNEMTDKELKAFMEHMHTCGECREELEVYYTIYAGLAQLENDSDNFDMRGLLEHAMQESENRIRFHAGFNVFYIAIQLLAVASLVLMTLMKWRA